MSCRSPRGGSSRWGKGKGKDKITRIQGVKGKLGPGKWKQQGDRGEEEGRS